MLKYIIKRILWIIPILIGVTIVVFTILYFSPGDPAYLALGDNATPEAVEAYRIEMGINGTYWERLGRTLLGLFQGVSEEVYTEVVIKVNNLTRARAKSFSMEGWFRLTSSKEIVSVYGLDGTFEYTGSSATATGSSGYHNPTASGWSGTYNLSDEESDDGSASIIGNYTLKKSGKYNNSASCKAKCSKSGKISFSGDYDESTII